MKHIFYTYQDTFMVHSAGSSKVTACFSVGISASYTALYSLIEILLFDSIRAVTSHHLFSITNLSFNRLIEGSAGEKNILYQKQPTSDPSSKCCVENSSHANPVPVYLRSYCEALSEEEEEVEDFKSHP